MKQNTMTFNHTFAKDSASSSNQRPFPLRLFLLITIILAGLSLTVGYWQMGHSQNGQAVLVLLKACYKLVPPLLWLSGLALVTLWLTILGLVWRQQLQ